MTVLTTLGLDQALRNNWPRALLFWFDHPDGEVNFWTGAGPLQYLGVTYTGVGPLISVSGIGGEDELRVRELRFILSGIPETASGYLNKNVRNRVGKVWMAGLNESGHWVNGLPYLLTEGTADFTEVEVQEGLNVALTINANTPVFSMERAQNLKLTPEWVNEERQTLPDSPTPARITGLDLMSTLADQVESWTLV